MVDQIDFIHLLGFVFEVYCPGKDLCLKLSSVEEFKVRGVNCENDVIRVMSLLHLFFPVSVDFNYS